MGWTTAELLGTWIAINAADAGIRQDYPKYRANHRKVTGDTLVIAERQQFRSFNSYAPSEARLMLHRIRFGPTKMTDLGKTPAVPEFDLIDDLFLRLNRHQSTAAIASRQVASLVHPLAAETGMLETISIAHTGQTTTVCLVNDDSGRIDFTLSTAAGKLRLTHATHLPTQGSCPIQKPLP